MLFYFSGTGNSAYVAEKISQVTGETLCSINKKIKTGESAPETAAGERLVFVVPTSGWRIPRIVENWIRSSHFPGNRQAYFVMTCGSDIGSASKYLQKLCRAKGFDYRGCAEIVMPENYIALFTTPEREEALEIIKRAEPAIERAAWEIANGRILTEPVQTASGKIKSSLVNTIYYPTMIHAKKFYATDACISCGKCQKDCPLNNVSIVCGKPKWGKDCTHCMACICGCPAEAIEYGNHSKGLPRYQFPK